MWNPGEGVGGQKKNKKKNKNKPSYESSSSKTGLQKQATADDEQWNAE